MVRKIPKAEMPADPSEAEIEADLLAMCFKLHTLLRRRGRLNLFSDCCQTLAVAYQSKPDMLERENLQQHIFGSAWSELGTVAFVPIPRKLIVYVHVNEEQWGRPLVKVWQGYPVEYRFIGPVVAARGNRDSFPKPSDNARREEWRRPTRKQKVVNPMRPKQHSKALPGQLEMFPLRPEALEKMDLMRGVCAPSCPSIQTTGIPNLDEPSPKTNLPPADGSGSGIKTGS